MCEGVKKGSSEADWTKKHANLLCVRRIRWGCILAQPFFKRLLKGCCYKFSKSLTYQYSIPPFGNGRRIINGILFWANSNLAIK